LGDFLNLKGKVMSKVISEYAGSVLLPSKHDGQCKSFSVNAQKAQNRGLVHKGPDGRLYQGPAAAA